jgi:chromosome partitioning protein
MAIIVAVSNPKGGAGKSTTTLLLASYLAQNGASVCVVDADPRQWIWEWKKAGKTKSTLEVIGGVKEDTIADVLDSLEHQFVFIDLEGIASVLVSRSIAMAHYVLIPVQASKMDVEAAGSAINVVVGEEKILKRRDPSQRIPFKVILTRTPAPGAPVTGLQRKVEVALQESNLPRFKSSLSDRQAFKAIFAESLTIPELQEQNLKYGNLESAYLNVHQVAEEFINWLEGREVATQSQDEMEVVNG